MIMRKIAGTTQNFKTILLGDSGVGKSSLFVRVTQGQFPRGSECPQATIQMDIGRKVFKIYHTPSGDRNGEDEIQMPKSADGNAT